MNSAFSKDHECHNSLKANQHGHTTSDSGSSPLGRWTFDTLPEPIDSNKFEVKHQSSTGDWHTFDDANEVDEEGYLIFAEAD